MASRPPDSEFRDRETAVRQPPLPSTKDALTATRPHEPTAEPTKTGGDATTPPQERAPAPILPEKIGPYDILECLGRGGMGIIYKGRHRLVGQVRAIKTMRFDGANPEYARRFLREMQATVRLSHRHIVTIYEVEPEADPPYYTMEYVAGGTLSAAAARIRPDCWRIAEIVEKVALAVQEAHDQRIYHRDLKPGNILIDDDGEPLVTDFGLAKLPDPDPDATCAGTGPGTLPYMAPEQVEGRPDAVGPASDIWSLGVMLYELITGSRPFTGHEGALRRAIVNDPPALPSALRPGLDRTLEAITLHCLEKDPSRRYASAAALAKDLRAWLNHEPTSVIPETRLKKARRWMRRHWRVVAIGAGLVSGAIVSAAMMHLSDPKRPVYEGQARLRRGETWTLLGSTGPKWSSWVQSVGSVTKGPPGQPRPFGFSCADFGLLELVPDPALDRYSFRAEVRQDNGGSLPPSEVGLYIGRAEEDGCQVFWLLSFTENLKKLGEARPNPTRLKLFNPRPGQGNRRSRKAAKCRRVSHRRCRDEGSMAFAPDRCESDGPDHILGWTARALGR